MPLLNASATSSSSCVWSFYVPLSYNFTSAFREKTRAKEANVQKEFPVMIPVIGRILTKA
jgi:hypothetical protein